MIPKRFIGCFLLLLLSSLAFTPLQTPNPELPLFQDSFGYLTDALLKGAFSAWKDGAKVTISLAPDRRQPANPAMRVELLGPNEKTASRDASIFRILQLQERDWSGAQAVRFWIDNPSDAPLILSFNFKEEFNEYWATSGSQVFLLENEIGELFRRDAQYGNLPIPGGFIGYVILPFEGLRVPDWNTARGDFVMDTSAVESFALGVSADQQTPRHFFVDEFQVLAGAFPYLEINGPDEIEIPASGELSQVYHVNVIIPGWHAPLNVEPAWSLVEGGKPAPRIDEVGRLIVPAGVEGQKVILRAEYPYADRLLRAETAIHLKSDQAEELPQALDTPAVKDPALREKSAYEQFSEDFEKWSFENRSLFVILSVGTIVLVVVALSFFQKRIR